MLLKLLFTRTVNDNVVIKKPKVLFYMFYEIGKNGETLAHWKIYSYAIHRLGLDMPELLATFLNMFKKPHDGKKQKLSPLNMTTK